MDLLDFCKNIDNLILEKSAKAAISKPVSKKWITDAITKRLYGVGLDGFYNELITDNPAGGGDYYSLTTINEKRQKGQKYSNVTLNDSGEFYKSFKVLINDTSFEIIADFDKEDGHISKNFGLSYPTPETFEDAITSLNKQEFEQFIFNIIYDNILLYIKSKLTNGI